MTTERQQQKQRQLQRQTQVTPLRGRMTSSKGMADREKLFEDAGYYVVVVGVGDFGAVEGAGDEGFVGAEVVDEDLAVDLGGVECGASLPEEWSLFGFAFDEEVDLAAYPGGFGFRADLLLQLHQLAAAGLDGAVGDFEFVVEIECGCAFFVGV